MEDRLQLLVRCFRELFIISRGLLYVAAVLSAVSLLVLSVSYHASQSHRPVSNMASPDRQPLSPTDRLSAFLETEYEQALSAQPRITYSAELAFAIVCGTGYVARLWTWEWTNSLVHGLRWKRF